MRRNRNNHAAARASGRCEAGVDAGRAHLHFAEIVYRFAGLWTDRSASRHGPPSPSPLPHRYGRSCRVLFARRALRVQRSHLCSENNYSELSTLCHARVFCAHTMKATSARSRALSISFWLQRPEGIRAVAVLRSRLKERSLALVANRFCRSTA